MAHRTGAYLDEKPRKFLQGLVEDLIVYAEHSFARSRPAGDGATHGDHQDSGRRQLALLGKREKPAEDAPAFPEPLDYLWRWFLELANGCDDQRVTWCELQAWSAATGHVPVAWETAALMRLGALLNSVRADRGYLPATWEIALVRLKTLLTNALVKRG